jgi:hypothetical protein
LRPWRKRAALIGLLCCAFLAPPTLEAAADPRKVIHWYDGRRKKVIDPAWVEAGFPGGEMKNGG